MGRGDEYIFKVEAHPDGTLVFLTQSEVENLAIDRLGTHMHIYRDPVPFGAYVLVFSAYYRGWVLTSPTDTAV